MYVLRYVPCSSQLKRECVTHCPIRNTVIGDSIPVLFEQYFPDIPLLANRAFVISVISWVFVRVYFKYGLCPRSLLKKMLVTKFLADFPFAPVSLHRDNRQLVHCFRFTPSSDSPYCHNSMPRVCIATFLACHRRRSRCVWITRYHGVCLRMRSGTWEMFHVTPSCTHKPTHSYF
jgi:hypothetical protein